MDDGAAGGGSGSSGLLRKFREAQADRAEADKTVAALRSMLLARGETDGSIDATIDEVLFKGLKGAHGVPGRGEAPTVAFGASRELLMRELRSMRARAAASRGVITEMTDGGKSIGGGGDLGARKALSSVAAALEHLAENGWGKKDGVAHVTFAGMDTGLHRRARSANPPGEPASGGGRRRTPRSSNASPRSSRRATPRVSSSTLGGPAGRAAGGSDVVALNAMGARMQQRLEQQLRALERSQRLLEERHREESARLEREMMEKAETARRAEEAAREAEERAAAAAKEAVDASSASLRALRSEEDVGATEEPGEATDLLRERAAEELRASTESVQAEAAAAAAAAAAAKQVREAEAMRAQLEEFRARAAEEREELHRRQTLEVERQQAAAAAELNRVIAAGFERQESAMKDALNAAAVREEAALREVTRRAVEEAAKHAGSLERDLGAARAEARALREEVAASDATKHEVKALQRRLLAAQVDARLGWAEVQKLHLARMARMEAAMGGFNQREEMLLTELNECRVQLEIETREHARLRETHREVVAEAAAGREARHASEVDAAKAAEAAAAARDAAVREVSRAREAASRDVANVRAHFESLAAAGKPRADAALSAAVESLHAELAEARRQRSVTEADLFNAMRVLRGYSADLAAARQELVALHAAEMRRQERAVAEDTERAALEEAKAKALGTNLRLGGLGGGDTGRGSPSGPPSSSQHAADDASGSGVDRNDSPLVRAYLGVSDAAGPGKDWVGKGAPSMASGVHGVMGVSGGVVTGGDVTGVGAAGVDVVAMARRRLESAGRKTTAGGPTVGGLAEADLEAGGRSPPVRPRSPEVEGLLGKSEEARGRLEELARTLRGTE